jgi:hypothetical protein
MMGAKYVQLIGMDTCAPWRERLSRWSEVCPVDRYERLRGGRRRGLAKRLGVAKAVPADV